mgnify:CR=1 FL=1
MPSETTSLTLVFNSTSSPALGEIEIILSFATWSDNSYVILESSTNNSDSESISFASITVSSTTLGTVVVLGFVEIIPDRIEAGTYIIAAAAVGENVTVNNVIPQHIEALTSKLEEMGAKLEIGSDYVKVIEAKNLKSVDIITQPFPGFATDLQQPLTTLLTQANGDSHIEETLYLERFRHCDELNLMGANIEHKTGHSTIHGPTPLKGAEITARDLRCGAALVIAGLRASSITYLEREAILSLRIGLRL